ncbi:MAG: immunoglobulin domain-containing protein, partial [Blastocatellia bacterium]
MVPRKRKVRLVRVLAMAAMFAGGCGSSGGSKATAPSISAQPASASVSVGQTAAFSVTAIGTSPLSYQWQKNGANISGANSSSYTTPATQASDSGSTFD